MNGLGMTMLWCAVQVTLFLALAAPVYLLARRLHPRAGTVAALGSLMAVIALSLMAGSSWPRWKLNRQAAGGVVGEAAMVEMAAVGGDAKPASGGEVAVDPGLDAAAPASSTLGEIWNALRLAMTAPAPADANEEPPRWPLVVVGLALAGLAIGAVHLIGGLVAVKRLVRRSGAIDDADLIDAVATMRAELGIARPVAVRESAEVATPATVGWQRPVVLLPAAWRSWGDAERESVLAHELAHVEQRDFAAWLVARLAIVLHFYHPLVRWFAQRLQLDQELAADAAAVRLLGDRDEYLRALANLALATPMHRIAGPARTFIPGRSLLVRRVEMLRTNDVSKSPAARGTRVGRWLSLGAIAGLAILAAGVRSPSLGLAEEAKPQAAGEATAVAAEDTPYDFAYVPEDSLFVMALRPSAIAASSRLAPLAKLLGEDSRQVIPFESLEQVTLVMPMPKFDDQHRMKPGSGSEYGIFRTAAATDFTPMIKAAYGTVDTETHNGSEVITWSRARGTIAFYSPDDRTLISHPKVRLIEVMNDPNAAQAPKAATEWQAAAKGPLFATANMTALRNIISLESPPMTILGPAIRNIQHLTVTTDDSEPFVIRATAKCKSAEDAATALETLKAALVLAKNFVASQQRLGPVTATGAPIDETEMKLFGLAGLVLDAMDVKVDGETITATASIEDVASALNQLAPAIQGARSAAMRTQSLNNLKQLALAMHLHHDARNSLPARASYSADGKPLLSWRVHLLPYLEQVALYQQFRLDEPWDSEANLKLLAQMPAVYRAPEDEVSSTNASYFAVTGPGTPFDGRQGATFREFTDGLSNTILLVEAKQATPWTKPEDVAYDPDGAVPKLGGWRGPGEFLTAFADGSVHAMRNVDDDTLRRWIGKADGLTVPLPREVQPPQP